MTGIRHVVWTWLHTLDQEHLFESFLENGYDDLETVKQMGEEDLLAIGVDDQETRFVISQAARMLRERGAAWVYFIRYIYIVTCIYVSFLRRVSIHCIVSPIKYPGMTWSARMTTRSQGQSLRE